MLRSQDELKAVDQELKHHEEWAREPYKAYRDPELRRYGDLKQRRSELVEQTEKLGKPQEIAAEIANRLRGKAFEPEWLMDQMQLFTNRRFVEPLVNRLYEVQRKHLPRTLAAFQGARRAGEPAWEHWLDGAERHYGTMQRLGPSGMGEVVRSVKSMVRLARQRSIQRDRGRGHSL